MKRLALPSLARGHGRGALALFVLPVLLALVGVAACDKGDDESGSTTKNTASATDASASGSGSSGSSSSSTGGGGLQWYSTCGDPVCMAYNGPWDGVPACTAAQVEGMPCDQQGAQCDFMSECNAVLVCTTSDPKQQEGGCPISRARFKESIEYLDADARAARYRDLRGLRLATYRYRDARTPRRHLGILLEDQADAPWIDGAHDRVDLYGYTSLAIAGIQTQADELEALRAELRSLRAEVSALRAGRCE